MHIFNTFHRHQSQVARHVCLAGSRARFIHLEFHLVPVSFLCHNGLGVSSTFIMEETSVFYKVCAGLSPFQGVSARWLLIGEERNKQKFAVSERRGGKIDILYHMNRRMRLLGFILRVYFESTWFGVNGKRHSIYQRVLLERRGGSSDRFR